MIRFGFMFYELIFHYGFWQNYSQIGNFSTDIFNKGRKQADFKAFF